MAKLWSKLGRGGLKQDRTVRLEIENLENRLVPSFAGAPPEAINPATPATLFKLNAAGIKTVNAAITQNENDLFTFVAPTTGNYLIATQTPTSNLDTVLGVYDNLGNLLDFNDDIDFDAGITDSQVIVPLNAGDKVFVAVSNFADPDTGAPSPGGTYRLFVGGERGDDLFENNDTRTTAADLGKLNGKRTVNDLVLADAADFYKFTIGTAGAATDNVQIQFSNALGNLNLALFNAAGTRLRLSATTADTETVSLNNLAPGTYTIRVTGANGAFNPHYTLNLNFGTLPDPNPTPAPAPGAFHIQLNLTGMNAQQAAIFQQAAARWEAIITGDLPNATFQGQTVDDVLIDASIEPIDGTFNTLAFAGPDAFRSSGLPIHGHMTFDSADIARETASGELLTTVTHEMGHVLGIGTIWDNLSLLAGAGTSNSRFTGPLATAEFNALFHRSATGVPLEFQLGPGSNDSHWRESLFGNEIMSPIIDGATDPISRITVASLADIGYTVNFAAADPYTPPAGAISLQVSTTGTTTGASLIAAELSHDLLNEGQSDNGHGTKQTQRDTLAAAFQTALTPTVLGSKTQHDDGFSVHAEADTVTLDELFATQNLWAI